MPRRPQNLNLKVVWPNLRSRLDEQSRKSPTLKKISKNGAIWECLKTAAQAGCTEDQVYEFLEASVGRRFSLKHFDGRTNAAQMAHVRRIDEWAKEGLMIFDEALSTPHHSKENERGKVLKRGAVLEVLGGAPVAHQLIQGLEKLLARTEGYEIESNPVNGLNRFPKTHRSDSSMNEEFFCIREVHKIALTYLEAGGRQRPFHSLVAEICSVILQKPISSRRVQDLVRTANRW